MNIEKLIEEILGEKILGKPEYNNGIAKAVQVVKEYAAKDINQNENSNIMKISEIPIRYKFTHPKKGEGVVIKRTKRSLTVSYSCSTVKATYKHNDAEFNILDF